MKMIQVITYSSSNESIDLTPEQIRRFEAAGVWPKDQRGQEFCQVSKGLQSAHDASFSDAEIERIIDGENAGQILADQFYSE